MCVLVRVVRAPAEVLRVDVEYSCSGHSSWSSSLQMRDLEEQTHGRRQTYPLIAGQSQNLDKEKKKIVKRFCGVSSNIYRNANRLALTEMHVKRRIIIY